MEYKHHKLARSLRSGPTDRDLKPNASTRDQLNVMNVLLLSYYAAVLLAALCVLPIRLSVHLSICSVWARNSKIKKA